VSTPDPVAQRRARLAVVVRIAKRLGYGCLLVAIVAFAVGLATGFPAVAVALSIGGLVGSCIVLPVPIVMGYGIRAAERDERAARRDRRP
jgi:hypothetical protein